MMMMMNCFCEMVDRRKAFSLISSWDHCQRSSLSLISDTPRAGFELAQNLSIGFVEWSCAVVITTTPWRSLWKPVELRVASGKKTRANGKKMGMIFRLSTLKLLNNSLNVSDPTSKTFFCWPVLSNNFLVIMKRESSRKELGNNLNSGNRKLEVIIQ